MRPFPALLNFFLVSFEIILPFAGFEKMNQELIEIGETPYANPRNTASGSLKLQDSAEVAKRPLDCLLYFLIIAFFITTTDFILFNFIEGFLSFFKSEPGYK